MIAGLIQKAKFLVVDNSSVILTSMGVSGTVATAYLSGRASFRAAQIINQKQLENENYDSISDPLSKTTKVKLVWKLYIPPVAVGATTVTSIIVANKLSSKKIAALAVASGISERALQEYKAKVVEKLGVKHETAIRDEIAQDRVNKYPPTREVLLAGTGEVLCYDMTTGRYFMSSVEDIKRAENKINHSLIHSLYASLSEFYDEIGLPPTNYTDSVGWSDRNSPFEVLFSTTMSPDQRPCIAIDFARAPVENYNRLHD